jgi:hypothetical protein
MLLHEFSGIYSLNISRLRPPSIIGVLGVLASNGEKPDLLTQGFVPTAFHRTFILLVFM